MPKLSDLTDYQVPQPEEVPADIPRVYINGQGIENKKEEKGTVQKITDRLLGLNGEERYQLWPEKVVREGLSAAGDVMSGATPEWAVDPATGDVHTSPQMVEKAQAISALAGTGGLAGPTDATLGATPFLRPALKYKDRLYKGKEGQSHQDVIPEALYPEFNRMAMSGEDISHYNFGFHNDKGHFLNREDALKYGIDTGLIDPQASKFGALTSTLMADSSKPGTAIEAMAKTGHNEGLSYLIAPKSKAMGIGEESGKFNPNGFSTFKVAAPDGYLGHRIIYSENGKPLGAMQITKTPDGKPTVANTYVAPEARRQGIATKLNDEATKVYGQLDRSEGPSEAGQAFRDSLNKQAEPFYSALEHNVAKINQSKMTGDQWLGTLSNKPGVKPEELDWTGLRDFLKENGKIAVTKDQIESHLAANKVGLKEVQKADKIQIDPVVKYLHESFGPATQHIKTAADIADARKFNAHFRETTKGMSDEEVLAAARASEKLEGIGDAKFNRPDLVLPGGENYREMLLTLPSKSKTSGWKIRDNPDVEGEFEVIDHNGKVRYGTTEKEDAQKYINDQNGIDARSDAYKSSHWDEPNILAHVRMNDRNIEGKKSLHLEEIQSDWHQQGRDRGYASLGSLPKFHELNKQFEEARTDLGFATQKKAEELLGMSYQKYRQLHPDEKDSALQKLKDYRNKDPEYVALEKKVSDLDKARMEANPIGKIPDAPFKKTWHELALKRMIREAAEKNYDRISWTPGEAQAERYSLAKTLDKLSYNPKQKYLKAWDKNGQEVIAKEGVTPENLAEYVGKEGASKLLEQKPKDFERIPSVKKEDLKVTQTEHQYVVTNKGKRAVKIGKGTVGSEAEALEYAERHLNKTAFEVNNNREIEYGRLGPTHILEGQELKVGGEGMKGFYDQIIPKSLERIGKEHGVKVKSAEIPVKIVDTFGIYDRGGNLLHEFKTAADAHHWDMMNPVVGGGREVKQISTNKGKQPISYIDIPQSLKNTALHKGFPLFSSTHMFTPIAGDPFEKKK